MFRLGSAAAAVCALGLLTVGAGPATAATCSSASENTVNYGDPLGDAESGLAPDIVGGAVATVSNCGFGVAYDIGNQAVMTDGDFVSWFIDSDDNPATGLQSGFRGADHALGRLADDYVSLSRYNAATGGFAPVKEGFPVGEFGAGVHLSDFNASPGVTFRVAGGSSWTSPTGAAYFDFAPTSGTVGFDVQFSSGSGAGSAPLRPQPAGRVPAPGQDPIRIAPTVTGDAGRCRVPALRGRALSDARRRLSRANCRVGRITRVKSRRYSGRVIRSRPGGARVLAEGARVNLVVGRPRARASIAALDEAAAVNDAINALVQAR